MLAKVFGEGCNVLSTSRGSMSENGGEKKRGGGSGRVLMARKSYANIDELKGFPSIATSAINGESRGGGGRSG